MYRVTNPSRECSTDFQLVKPQAGFVPALTMRVWATKAVQDGQLSALTDLDDSRDCARALDADGLITLAQEV